MQKMSSPRLFYMAELFYTHHIFCEFVVYTLVLVIYSYAVNSLYTCVCVCSS